MPRTRTCSLLLLHRRIRLLCFPSAHSLPSARTGLGLLQPAGEMQTRQRRVPLLSTAATPTVEFAPRSQGRALSQARGDPPARAVSSGDTAAVRSPFSFAILDATPVSGSASNAGSPRKRELDAPAVVRLPRRRQCECRGECEGSSELRLCTSSRPAAAIPTPTKSARRFEGSFCFPAWWPHRASSSRLCDDRGC